MSETRQRLLDATGRCLASHGMSGTTSRAITTEAGVNLASITYHFGSKDRLVATALVTSLRDWVGPAVEVLRSDLDPASRTARAVQVLLGQFESHRDRAGLYLEAIAQSSRVPEVGHALAEMLREVEELFAAQMREMAAAGELPAWVDASAMAALLTSVATGLIVHGTVDRDGPSVAAMAAQFASLLLDSRRT